MRDMNYILFNMSYMGLLGFCNEFNSYFHYFVLVVLKILFIHFWREEKGERKRGRETLLCGCLLSNPETRPAAQACVLTGN